MKTMPKDKKLQEDQSHVHSILHKSVEAFRYWTRNIKIYHQKEYELKLLEDELEKDLEVENKRAMRSSTDQVSKEKAHIYLKGMIDRFLGKDVQQSDVMKQFLGSFIESRAIKDKLSAEHFKDIEPTEIEEIINSLANQGRFQVKRGTINTNLKEIQKLIADYQRILRPAEENQSALASTKEKIKLTKAELLQIRRDSFELEFAKISITLNNANSSIKEETKESPKVLYTDTTNFVAAEIGFWVHSSETNLYKYYSYPVTFPGRNTFSIYNIESDGSAYMSIVGGRIQHNIGSDGSAYMSILGGRVQQGNHITDRFLEGNKDKKKKAEPTNDYHSETTLFLLLQQNWFQKKIIKQLAVDIEKDRIEITKLPKFFIEIHSTNDMCDQCFVKAKDLVDWKANNKSRPHFLECFRNKLLEAFNIPKKSIKEKDLEVEINFTYSDDFEKSSSAKHARITREKIGFEESSVNSNYGHLCKYSIIRSGGLADCHKNYAAAYNKAIEEKLNRAQKIFKKYWQMNKANIVVKHVLSELMDNVCDQLSDYKDSSTEVKVAGEAEEEDPYFQDLFVAFKID